MNFNLFYCRYLYWLLFKAFICVQLMCWQFANEMKISEHYSFRWLPEENYRRYLEKYGNKMSASNGTPQIVSSGRNCPLLVKDWAQWIFTSVSIKKTRTPNLRKLECPEKFKTIFQDFSKVQDTRKKIYRPKTLNENLQDDKKSVNKYWILRI